MCCFGAKLAKHANHPSFEDSEREKICKEVAKATIFLNVGVLRHRNYHSVCTQKTTELPIYHVICILQLKHFKKQANNIQEEWW